MTIVLLPLYIFYYNIIILKINEKNVSTYRYKDIVINIKTRLFIIYIFLIIIYVFFLLACEKRLQIIRSSHIHLVSLLHVSCDF